MKLHGNLKKCILCFSWAEYSGICHVDYATVLVVLFSSSILLMILSLVILLLSENRCWDLNNKCGYGHFSFQPHQFYFIYFEIQLFWCVHIKDCLVLLMDLSFYHFVISSMPLIFFVPKSTLSDIMALGMDINFFFFFTLEINFNGIQIYRIPNMFFF